MMKLKRSYLFIPPGVRRRKFFKVLTKKRLTQRNKQKSYKNIEAMSLKIKIMCIRYQIKKSKMHKKNIINQTIHSLKKLLKLLKVSKKMVNNY